MSGCNRRAAHSALLPPPLAGEGWGGGELAQVCVRAPSLSLPRKRGRGRCGTIAHHQSQRAMTRKATIAIATGDPAGIGPEISLKAALDPAVRAACNPMIVSDARLVARHAEACGITTELRIDRRIARGATGPTTW